MQGVSGEGKAPAPYRHFVSNTPDLMEFQLLVKRAALKVKRCIRNPVLCCEPEPWADASKQERDTGSDEPFDYGSL